MLFCTGETPGAEVHVHVHVCDCLSAYLSLGLRTDHRDSVVALSALSSSPIFTPLPVALSCFSVPSNHSHQHHDCVGMLVVSSRLACVGMLVVSSRFASTCTVILTSSMCWERHYGRFHGTYHGHEVVSYARTLRVHMRLQSLTLSSPRTPKIPFLIIISFGLASSSLRGFVDWRSCMTPLAGKLKPFRKVILSLKYM